MRICSPSVPRLKHEWNHTVGWLINLRCGTAAPAGHSDHLFPGLPLAIRVIYCPANPGRARELPPAFLFSGPTISATACPPIAGVLWGGRKTPDIFIQTLCIHQLAHSFRGDGVGGRNPRRQRGTTGAVPWPDEGGSFTRSAKKQCQRVTVLPRPALRGSIRLSGGQF